MSPNDLIIATNELSKTNFKETTFPFPLLNKGSEIDITEKPYLDQLKEQYNEDLKNQIQIDINNRKKPTNGGTYYNGTYIPPYPGINGGTYYNGTYVTPYSGNIETI